VDVETTSFDDKVKAFHPFNGHRIVGVAIGTPDKQWYLPLRHREGGNLPLEPTLKWLRETLATRNIINHNVKFDGRFLAVDGIKTGPLADTMVLARLVDNTRWSYSLDSLSRDMLNETGKDKAVKAYLKSIKSVDYGRVPADIMGPYAMRDIELTAKLYKHLLHRLPPESAEVWETEKNLTPILLESEIAGVKINVRRLKEYSKICCEKLLALGEQIPCDPSSEESLTAYIVGELGLTPTAFTPKTGRPSWTQDSFMAMKHPIGKVLAEYSRYSYFLGSVTGWAERLDENGFLHPDFRQSGTDTGRMSVADPNTQGAMEEALQLIESGESIVGWDYSQEEWRIFAHYSNDAKIMNMFKASRDVDFHQNLATDLGIERDWGKTLNFAFLFGMGKKKLLANLVALLVANSGLLVFLQNKSGKKELPDIAEWIYAQYHAKYPSIRQFSYRVMNLVKSRGFIKNFFGRVYNFQDRGGYMAVNYVIQGSAADLLKHKLVEMYPAMKKLGGQLLITRHDDMYYRVPAGAEVEALKIGTAILEDTHFRVPIIAVAKVSAGALGRSEKVGEINNKNVKAAMKKSLIFEQFSFDSK